jgi:hypothetical protein
MLVAFHPMPYKSSNFITQKEAGVKDFMAFSSSFSPARDGVL